MAGSSSTDNCVLCSGLASRLGMKAPSCPGRIEGEATQALGFRSAAPVSHPDEPTILKGKEAE